MTNTSDNSTTQFSVGEVCPSIEQTLLNELQPKKRSERPSAEAVRQALGKRACKL